MLGLFKKQTTELEVAEQELKVFDLCSVAFGIGAGPGDISKDLNKFRALSALVDELPELLETQKEFVYNGVTIKLNDDKSFDVYKKER